MAANIRPYAHGDLEAVTVLMEDLGYPTSMDNMLQRMSRIESIPEYATFVAEQDGQVVGMIGVRQVYYYEGNGHVTQIALLVVTKEHQGQGIGSGLLSFVESWAKERGSASLYLTSGNKPERLEAHALYRRAGYESNGYRFVKSI